MKPKSVFLSVVVPVFNEEKTVSTIIKKILTHLPPHSEIVVVNDGSFDNTAKILSRFKTNKKIRVFNLPQNKGKGYATRFGFQHSRGQILLIQDADLEYDPKYYQALLVPITSGQAHIVYGSRLSKIPLTLHNLKTIPLPLNFLANKILSWFSNLLYGSHLTDMETCYKVFTRGVYKKLNLKNNGFGIDPEITAQLLRLGYSITEIPITTKPRTYQEGKKITWHDGYRTVFILLKYRLDRFHLTALGILLVAIFFRFYDFTNRYGLWSDQARDAIVGRISIVNRTLPLIGSFSSAGPFTFGPYWYWFSALMAVLVKSHLGYWIGMGIASCIMVVALMWLAKRLGGNFMAVTMGLLSATSLGLTQSSLGSTQHSAVGVVVTFALISTYLYLKHKNGRQLALTFFLIGLAVNFHYQALYLYPMLILLVLTARPKLLSLLWAIWWGFVPYLPMLIFDLQHNWWNLTKLTDYYRFGQHRIYVPNRWLTYAGLFWPDFWASILGLYRSTAYVLMSSIALLFSHQLLRKKLTRPFLVYGIGFLMAVVWFRYFKAERNFGYVVFSQPLILVFTSWLIYRAYHYKKVVGYLILLFLLGTNLLGQYKNASYSNSYQAVKGLKQSLISYRPQASFALYDLSFYSTGCSISLTLFLDDQAKASNTGYPIGVCPNSSCPPEYPLIASQMTGGYACNLVDLSDYQPQGQSLQDWILVSPTEVHRMTVEWWKTEPSLQN